MQFQAFLLTTAACVALSGCAATRMAKPVEAYGKALSGIDSVLGDGSSIYRKSTRYALLENIQASSSLLGAPAIDPLLARIVVAANELQPSTQPTMNAISILFVCNPLKASYPSARAASELGAVGKSLADVASASPTTLVGLVLAMQQGYEVEWPKVGDQDNQLAQEIQTQCKAVSEQAFAATINSDTDMIELDGINGKAWQEGDPSGAAPASGFAAVIAVIDAIKGVLVQGLTIADQAKRAQAVAAFFDKPENVAEFHSAIRRIDQAARVAQLTARMDAKEGFRAAWKEYAQARRDHPSAARLGDDKDLLEAARNLVATSLELDVTARAKAADVIGKRTYDEVNRCRTSQEATGSGQAATGEDKTAPPPECPRTALGKALYAALDRLHTTATSDWEKMKVEDKQAFLESAFAVFSATAKLSNDLAGFENDKDNFRKLANVIDDLPW